jgi:hypothetical protein
MLCSGWNRKKIENYKLKLAVYDASSKFRVQG